KLAADARQLFPGLLPLGDVLHVHRNAAARSRIDMHLVPAVVVGIVIDHRARNAPGRDLSEALLEAAADEPRVFFPDDLAEKLFRRQADDAFGLRIDVREAPFPVDGIERIADAFEHVAGDLLALVALVFGVHARGDVFMDDDDFGDGTACVPDRKDDGRQPALRILDLGNPGDGVVRVVLGRRNPGGLAGEGPADEFERARLLELRIFQNVVPGELFEADAPEPFEGLIDANRTPVRREDLNAERSLFEQAA